jgi:uncharacterized protein YndB with AHSA1/START domain
MIRNQTLAAHVRDRVMEPAQKVFEAIVDPDEISGYFTSSASGRLEAGRAVEWRFADVGGMLKVLVEDLQPGRSVSFNWTASGVPTQVQISLLDEAAASTLVDITESGWPMDEDGVGRALGQTQGWTDFICSMKAYLMCGVRLRTGRTADSH